MSSIDEDNEKLSKDDYLASADADTTCDKCMAEFLDVADLEIHIAQVHNELSYIKRICQFCSIPYTDLMSYAVHIRDNHITSLINCKFCSKTFLDSELYISHNERHSVSIEKGTYKCSQCRKVFNKVKELNKHEFQKHNNATDGILLDNLFPYLSAVLNVKSSVFIQEIGTETLYACAACDYLTPELDAFVFHAQTSECKSFVCDSCSNAFKTKIDLGQHSCRGHKSIKITLNKKQCPECNELIKIKEYKVHTKKCKVIKCVTCNIIFKNMYEMSEHQLKEHPLAVELKTCQICFKQCVGTVALQTHMDRTHKKQLHLYKYRCVTCDIVFKHPQKLFGHYFSKHKDLCPYTCKICNKQFKLRKKFTIHIKLDHKSVGFVEFDENYCVFFTDKKSENPFIPKSKYEEEVKSAERNEQTGKEASKIEESNIQLVENSDFITETEDNQTELETSRKIESSHVRRIQPKRKRMKSKKVLENDTPVNIDSSDDEPLYLLKKRSKPRKKQSKFICDVCNKNCYTYQNYKHHVSLHSKNDKKKCIKCSKVFKRKDSLTKHIETEHSSSKLIDTLKNLIEKRKTGFVTNNDVSMADRFRRTIKKVSVDSAVPAATITPVENGISVKKFIENFTPETENVKHEIEVSSDVSIKVVHNATKKRTIKLTKFVPKPINYSSRLSLPVKFKEAYHEKTVVSVKMVQEPIRTYEEDSYQYDDNDIDRDEIPEVAEEVMLEETEEPPKPVQIPHRIVIPKLPMEYKDIRIAHLLPEAPFYKIVKVNDVLKTQLEEKAVDPPKSTFKLSDGTKFVTTNPLAHLLGNIPVEKVLEPTKSKYYKAKPRDLPNMLAEALSKLDKPAPSRKRKKDCTFDNI